MFSLAIKKGMIRLGQGVSFEESKDYLETLMGVSVSHRSIQTLVESVGKQNDKDEKRRVSRRLDSDGHLKKTHDSSRSKKKGTAYMQMDGSMVQTREEGWKEEKLGVLFRDVDNVRTDPHHKRILNKRYFAVFNARKNSLDAFKNRATQEADAFGFQSYENRVILADGAKWIWDYVDIYHLGAVQILDYYHASEYLGDTFKTLQFESETEKESIKKILFDHLWEGRISSILSYLAACSPNEQIRKCVGYFKNNSHRMNYALYRSNRFTIGSGAIESAHRTVVQCRMKQSGMHWKKWHVQSIVSLRAKFLSGHWDNIVDS